MADRIRNNPHTNTTNRAGGAAPTRPQAPAGGLSPAAAAAAASRELDRLIESSPQPNSHVPYRAINPDAVEAIITKYFGPIDQMSPAQASAAAPLLEDLGAGAVLGLRPAFVNLHERVEARTGGDAAPAAGGWRPGGSVTRPPVTPVTTQPATPQPPAQPPTRLGGVVHASGPTVIEGAQLNAAALGKLNNLAMDKFGTTTVSLPQADGTSKSYTVRDMQYDLGDGKVGARLVPVKDHDAPGNKAMDDLIRQQSGLGPNDPIYALIAYIHPEEHAATLKDAATRMLKTEMGNTHLGAYVGEGKTTNSPETYHDKTWNVSEGKPYPANVQLVSMEGTPQALLNKNLVTADSVLNKGVQFPPDYKNDPMRTTDLNTNLMFYRDWIKNEPHLKSDPSWATYCAEHKTIATNIGLNVPHNAESFKEIFGAREGAELWDKFKTKFKEANGRDFTTADETNFEPLWKKEGLTADQIRPPTKAQYDAYQAARFDGSLANGSYTGYKPLPSGKGMAWRPETTADLVKNFMETYAPFNQVGGYASVASIMGFKDTVTERMGIDTQKYLETAMPVLNKIMVAEGMARAPSDPAQFQAWAQKATGGLYVAMGGKMEDLAPGGTVNQQLMELAKNCMKGVATSGPQIMQAATLPAEQRNDMAYGWMRGAIEADMENARSVRVANPSLTEAYSPPAVTNRVINGMVDKSKFVTLRVIATAVDAKDVQ